MSKLEKAVAQLVSCGIPAHIENCTVYVEVNEHLLEIAKFEITFRAVLYDEQNV